MSEVRILTDAPSDGTRNSRYPKVTYILNVPISVFNMEEAVSTIVGWAQNGLSNYVCVRDVHGVILARKDRALLDIHHGAGAVTPDGMPLVWIARLREGAAVGRVCGADLVDALCSRSLQLGLRHFFYGAKPGVAKQMSDVLQRNYPGLIVAGTLSPPFGSVAPELDDEITRNIVAARPHIVWVGLSTPKQEFWMRDHVNRIPGATLIGIGAAFDFHTGLVARAPSWMQRYGFEWFHRLVSEPRRLWRRYLVIAPMFAVLALKEQVTGKYRQRP